VLIIAYFASDNTSPNINSKTLKTIKLTLTTLDLTLDDRRDANFMPEQCIDDG